MALGVALAGFLFVNGATPDQARELIATVGDMLGWYIRNPELARATIRGAHTELEKK